MTNKRVVLSLPEHIEQFISDNSTERTRSAFVAKVLQDYMNGKKSGIGILERIALAVEKKANEREEGKQ